jgi:hypothetical protein
MYVNNDSSMLSKSASVFNLEEVIVGDWVAPVA